MNRLWLSICLAAVVLVGVFLFVLVKATSTPTTSRVDVSAAAVSVPAAQSRGKSRLQSTATPRKASAVDITITYEPNPGHVPAHTRLYLKLSDRQKGEPAPGELTPLGAGINRVDLSDFPNGGRNFHVLADDYAPLWFGVTTRKGQIKTPEISVHLYRKRYVVLRYAYNPSGTTDLTGSKVQTGRVAMSHLARAQFFDGGWMIWQSGNGYSPHHDRATGSRDDMWGDTPVLEAVHTNADTGFRDPPAGATFDSNNAVWQSGYTPGARKAVANLLVYCRVPTKGGGYAYGKIFVESVSMTRPTDVQVIEPEYP